MHRYHLPVHRHLVVQPPNANWKRRVKDGGVVDDVVVHKPILERSVAEVKDILAYTHSRTAQVKRRVQKHTTKQNKKGTRRRIVPRTIISTPIITIITIITSITIIIVVITIVSCSLILCVVHTACR